MPATSVFENADEGTDAVFSTAHFGLSANVETLVLQGSADLQGYGNSEANTLYGNTGSNLLNGEGGADIMLGGAGNDVYFVDNVGDLVFENLNEGTDAVFSTVDYTLTANVETLVLQGAGNLSGTGNALDNKLFGNSGDNTLNGGAGADRLTGGAGNDTFVFNVGQANGDTIIDFAGNGAGAGDTLSFVGFGPGATFPKIDATHWQVNYNGGASHEIITFINGASIDPSDFVFLQDTPRRRAAEQRDEVAARSFDHLVGERRAVVGGTSRPSALAVLRLMHELEFGGLHDRQVGRLLALENPPGVDAGLAIGIGMLAP